VAVVTKANTKAKRMKSCRMLVSPDGRNHTVAHVIRLRYRGNRERLIRLRRTIFSA
jgi:hypothetical protein